MALAHEGNPLEDSITINAGDLNSVATLTVQFSGGGDNPVTPPANPTSPDAPGGSCPDCESMILSTANTDAIAVCKTDTGDGVVTFPGDYTFDPVFYGAACDNYYGAFRFGLNAVSFDDVDAPAWFTTVPSLWLPPKGSIIVNSSCPGIVTRQLSWDMRATASSASVDYTGITPATFQTSVINDWNSTGAHGQRSVATADGVANSGVTVGGFLDCRFQFVGSGSEYKTFVKAEYGSEWRTPIAGIAILTDDGTDETLTGFGLLINRFTGTLDTVEWADSALNSYVLLNSVAYTPTTGDVLNLQALQTCPCPYGSTDPSSVHPAYPKGGYIYSYVVPAAGFSATLEFSTDVPVYPDNLAGSLPPAEWQSLGYGGLLGLFVDNGFCDNYIIFSNVTTSFSYSISTC